jgi:hypothetical protein
MGEIDQIKQAYRKILSTPLGGVVLSDLAEYCNFLATTTGNSTEEGKRDVFLHILEMYGIESTYDVVEALQKIKPREEGEEDEYGVF